MRASFEARLKSEGHLTFEASSKIAKALHPEFRAEPLGPGRRFQSVLCMEG